VYSFILKLIVTYNKKKLIYTSKVFFQKCLVITILAILVVNALASSGCCVAQGSQGKNSRYSYCHFNQGILKGEVSLYY
jgi:hypothetical protein